MLSWYDDESAAVTPDEIRAADFSVVAFLGALIICLLGGALVVYADRRHETPTANFTTDNPAIEVPPGFLGRLYAVGPDRGDDIPTYLDERRKALASATGEITAVVSFDRYATEAEARAALPRNVKVTALLVTAIGGEPEVVRGTLEHWGDDVREASAEARKEIEKLIESGTIDDPEFERFYAEEVTRLKRLESSLDAAAPVVYGVLLEGPAADMRALAAAPGVRLVDPASGPIDDTTDIVGLRPEEALRAGEPATRP